MKTKFFAAFAFLVMIASPAFANGYTTLNGDNVSEVVRTDQTLLDYTGTTSGVPIYVGHAFKGSATSDNAWRICKTTDSANGPTVIQCTDGIWDNRSSLTYN